MKNQTEDRKRILIDTLYLDMFNQYEDILTAEEAADALRLDKKRIYRMVRSGELKSMTFGRSIRIPKLWIIEYVQEYGFIKQEKIHHQR